MSKAHDDASKIGVQCGKALKHSKRTIKFRLWCVNKKEWEKDAWFISPDGVVVDMRRMAPMVTGTHVLEQYTGLTDKHGVKIFEGDILQHPVDGEKFVVIFDNTPSAFRAQYNDGSTSSLFLQISEKGLAVVIGNIHEGIK